MNHCLECDSNTVNHEKCSVCGSKHIIKVEAMKMNVRELRLSKDTFDYAAKFRVAGVRGDVSLHSGYNKEDDGILWGLCGGIMIKSSYSPEEIEHRERMNWEKPIQQGEIVKIEGKYYKARILGDYSNCVIFDPAPEEREEKEDEGRITRRIGGIIEFIDGKRYSGRSHAQGVRLLFERLAAYEDTGLSPKEIIEMGEKLQKLAKYLGSEGDFHAWDVVDKLAKKFQGGKAK